MQNIDKISRNMADRLNQLLETHGMTQQDLADVLGVSQTAVYSWCNGKKTPRMDKVDKIAELFNVKRSYILGLDDDSFQVERASQRQEQIQGRLVNYAKSILNETHETTDIGKLQRIFAYVSAIICLPKDKQKQITDYIDYVLEKEGK